MSSETKLDDDYEIINVDILPKQTDDETMILSCVLNGLISQINILNKLSVANNEELIIKAKRQIFQDITMTDLNFHLQTLDLIREDFAKIDKMISRIKIDCQQMVRTLKPHLADITHYNSRFERDLSITCGVDHLNHTIITDQMSDEQTKHELISLSLKHILTIQNLWGKLGQTHWRDIQNIIECTRDTHNQIIRTLANIRALKFEKFFPDSRIKIMDTALIVIFNVSICLGFWAHACVIATTTITSSTVLLKWLKESFLEESCVKNVRSMLLEIESKLNKSGDELKAVHEKLKILANEVIKLNSIMERQRTRSFGERFLCEFFDFKSKIYECLIKLNDLDSLTDIT
jgi:hypothetical protein